ncbi:MAG: sigma-70 family RNA polymerase sigma factor [Myxococcota bacterium]
MADGSPKTTLTPPRPAFVVLYREHAAMVRRALRQLGVPPGSLDDAVQDVFVVLHRRIDDWQRDRSLKNWLWGIARGVASGYRRSQRRRDRLQAALPAPEGPGLPERGVARRQAGAILDDFLGSLDADKCAVFVLSEIEGRRGPEIAELLDVNLNTVYARLRAARKRFEAAMDRHHVSTGRPVFAAGLSWAWPAWLSKPAVAVSVSAVAVVAATQVVPLVAVEPAEASLAVVDGVAVTGAEDDTSHRWPRAVTPRVASRAVAPPEDDEEVVLVVEDDEDAPVAAVRPRRSISALPSREVEPEVAPVELVEAEAELGSPLAVPWSTAVVGQRPVHHPSLLTPRRDFIADLWRLAFDL